MSEFGRWVNIGDSCAEIAAEPFDLHWVSFSSESKEGDRALKDPLSVLKEQFPEVTDDWQVISTIVNHQRAFAPFGQIHFCQQWMLIPEDKLALGVVYKH